MEAHGHWGSPGLSSAWREGGEGPVAGEKRKSSGKADWQNVNCGRSY